VYFLSYKVLDCEETRKLSNLGALEIQLHRLPGLTFQIHAVRTPNLGDYMQGGLQPPSIETELEALVDSKRKVIFVLERANLEVAKVGKVIDFFGGLFYYSQC